MKEQMNYERDDLSLFLDTFVSLYNIRLQTPQCTNDIMSDCRIIGQFGTVKC